MIEVLLSTIITCSDAQRISLNVQKSEDLPTSVRREVLHEIKKAAPKNCKLFYKL